MLKIIACCSTTQTSTGQWNIDNHYDDVKNDHDGVSNHQPPGCLLSRLFRRRSKKTSKLRVTGLCVGNSPGPVNSPHKGRLRGKCFHLMTSSWLLIKAGHKTYFSHAIFKIRLQVYVLKCYVVCLNDNFKYIVKRKQQRRRNVMQWNQTGDICKVGQNKTPTIIPRGIYCEIGVSLW